MPLVCNRWAGESSEEEGHAGAETGATRAREGESG